MASVQCHNPTAQPNHHVQLSANGHKPSNGTTHSANNEHSFTTKVKEMANSAYKRITEHHHHKQHGSNCMPKLGDHKKKEKHNKKKKGDEGKFDSSSSSESEHEKQQKAKN